MKAETTQAMKDALEAAVVRMHNGNGASSSAASQPTDLMGVFMSILPKLLQSNEAGEEILEKVQEKIDGLQKGDLTTLREQVQLLRKQSHRLLNGQIELLAAIQEIQRQQSLANDAIVEIAGHLSRMQVIEDPLPVVNEAGYEPSAASVAESAARGVGSDQRRARQKTAKQNLNRARS